MRNEKKSIGDYIREQREQAKISVRQLAQNAGVSNPYLSQIERGLRKPSADILQQIAKGLRISAETLYVRAGILEDRPSDSGVRSALLTDPELTERQKQVLIEIYESFRKENAAAEAALASGAAAAAAADAAAEAEAEAAAAVLEAEGKTVRNAWAVAAEDPAEPDFAEPDTAEPGTGVAAQAVVAAELGSADESSPYDSVPDSGPDDGPDRSGDQDGNPDQTTPPVG
jgi:transcriptional regulator with XRE-family HTH domain